MLKIQQKWKTIANKSENNGKQNNSVNLWQSGKNIFRKIINTENLL